jgi:ABC-type Fe3+-siderophore transport system permease subunit
MGIGAPQGLEVRGLIEDEPLPVIERRGVFAGTSARALNLMVALAVLVLVTIASLAYGAKPIPTGTVLDALTAYDPSVDDHLIVQGLRLPRTLVGLLVGMALGLAGAVMQGVTRNPLADHGISVSVRAPRCSSSSASTGSESRTSTATCGSPS